MATRVAKLLGGMLFLGSEFCQTRVRGFEAG
jgi:hypothetical protein